jgi:hypothetical protein
MFLIHSKLELKTLKLKIFYVNITLEFKKTHVGNFAEVLHRSCGVNLKKGGIIGKMSPF